MLEALLLVAVALQLALRLARRPSLASRLLPLPIDGAPYSVWAGRLWLSFAVPSLAALLLLGRIDALWHMPAEFEPVAALARHWGRLEGWPTVIGLLLGSALGALAAWWRRRRGKRPVYLGRPPRLPLGWRELPSATALALSAGVTEEAYFRLVLPLLVTSLFGSALAGVAVSVLLFGAVHRYQGWVGVVATAAVGLFLHFIYLASGELWLAMACHAVIDVNSLVIRPASGFRSPAGR